MTRRRPFALGISLAAHAGLLALVLTAAPSPRRLVEPDVLPVEVAPRFLVPPPPPEPPKPEPPKPEKAAKAPAPRPVARLVVRKPRAAPPDVAPVVARTGPPSPPADELSEAELAGATVAGSGGGGSSCDMAGWLQAKLRADARVRAAVAATHAARPLLVWNGAWVQRSDQDGAGLAEVREAIIWEVGFAPLACRSQPVRGLVVLALNDGPSAPRLVLGRAAWRWGDLLHAHGGG